MKKVLSLILALAMCLSMAACGGSDEPDKPGETGEPGNPDKPSSHTCSGEWVVVEEPTCLKEGTRQRTCSCGDVATEAIPALAHTFAEGVCTACNTADPDYKPVTSQGLSYESNGDGTCSVTGLGTCTDTDIIIPEIAENGDRVTEIEMMSFDGEDITSVVIPEGVTRIGPHAFAKCKKLESVTIPASVTRIGGAAFLWCENLSKVYISDLKAWCKIEFPDSTYGPGQPMMYGFADLYVNGELITDLVIPEGITSLQPSAFNGCGSIKTVTFPESLTSLGNYVFARCPNLENITVPKNITSFGDGVFSDCKNLASVTFCSEEMPTFAGYPFWECPSLQAVYVPDALASQFRELPDWTEIADKVLPESTGAPVGPSDFSQGLEFISYGNGTCYLGGLGTCTDTEIKIPEISPAGDTVVKIGDYAFSGAYTITKIVIPNTVTEIGRHVFDSCTNLQTLDIPASVTSAYADMMFECYSLTTLILRCSEVMPWPPEYIIRPGSTFENITALYVPAELVEAYKADYGWSHLSDRILPITE